MSFLEPLSHSIDIKLPDEFEVNEDVGSRWVSLESKIGVGGLSIILICTILSFSSTNFGFSVLSL